VCTGTGTGTLTGERVRGLGWDRYRPASGTSGQSALQVVALRPGQSRGAPAQQRTISQSCVPAGAFGQSTTQLAPSGHSPWQGPLWHTKEHDEPWPQAQVPLAHVPSHCALSPLQRT
jgi:hypothetical protein